ncbi:MAG: ABC transporter permease subunit [Acidimicrobiales bacterium]
MTALLAGELRRLLSRRMIRVLALLAVAGIALGGVLTFLSTEKVSDAALRQRAVDAQVRLDQCLRGVGPPPATPNPKDNTLGPGADRDDLCRYRFDRVSDDRFKLEDLTDILKVITAPLVIVAWVIGSSSIGAEWQARSIATLLTWEPRRARVLLAKILASVIVACVFALLTWALLSAALLPSAFLHGTTANTGGDWGRSLAAVVGRGTLMIAIATAIGFAVASIGRNTAAALGVGFAYFLVIENVVGNFLAGFRRWLILGNSIVLIDGKDGGGDVAGRSVLAAGIYLTSVAVVLFAVATVLFRRRDVA